MKLQTRASRMIGRIRRPEIAVFILAASLMVVNLFIAQHTRPYNSDDVTWQTTFLTWRPFSGHILYLGGSDTYIIRAPFFLLIDLLFPPTRGLLLIEAAVLAVLNFALFYYVVLYFLKKHNIKPTFINLLPMVWLGSFGYYFARMFLNTNLRSFEIGLTFITFMVAAKLYYKELHLKLPGAMLATLAFAAASGLLVYNDPYYLYLGILPIALLFLIMFLIKAVSGRLMAIVTAWAMLSLLFAKASAHAAHHLGILVPQSYPVKIIPLDKLHSNLSLTTHAMQLIFGAHSISTVFDLFTVAGVINFIILVAYLLVIAYLLFGLAKSAVVSKESFMSNLQSKLWLLFFAVLGIFNMGVYTLSTLATDLGTYRYLVIMVFSWVLFLSLYIDKAGNKTVRSCLAALLVAASILNLALAISTFNYSRGDTTGNIMNRGNYAVINAIRKTGTTKGYAPYWDSAINTYLSGGNIKFLPSICADGRVHSQYWLVDTSLYRLPTSSSFYVIDPTTAPPSCTIPALDAQFGAPQKTISVGDKTILIYSYDIVTKM